MQVCDCKCKSWMGNIIHLAFGFNFWLRKKLAKNATDFPERLRCETQTMHRITAICLNKINFAIYHPDIWRMDCVSQLSIRKFDLVWFQCKSGRVESTKNAIVSAFECENRSSSGFWSNPEVRSATFTLVIYPESSWATARFSFLLARGASCVNQTLFPQCYLKGVDYSFQLPSGKNLSLTSLEPAAFTPRTNKHNR